MDKNFRDMCAIMAMQGILIGSPGQRGVSSAVRAFDIADEMVAERERRDARSPIADFHNKMNRGPG